MGVHGWSQAKRTALMAAPIFLVIDFFDAGAPASWLDVVGHPIPAAFAQDRAGLQVATQPIIRAGQVGQPLKLEIDAPNPQEVRFVRVLGLPGGFRLSRGFSVRDGSIWYVAATDVASVALIPPPDFAGVARVYVDFVMLEEAAGKPGRPKSQLYILKIGDETSSISLAAPVESKFPAAPVPPPSQPTAIERERHIQPYQEETAALARAQDLLGHGDVSSARLLYEDLALSGSAQGALALARTFDPEFLRSIGAIGMRPDLEMARKWYEKAAQLGNGEASRRLSESH